MSYGWKHCLKVLLENHYFIYKKQMNQEKRETKSRVTSDFGEDCK